MKNSGYLSAKEAADELDITLATLYSYVSRGLIRSEVADETKRTHRYHREDIQKLKERKEHRRNPAKAVENALHWGAPVMESAITLIADNRLYYRGKDVLQLATRHSVETVAALIWTGALSTDIPGLAEPVEIAPPARLQEVSPHLDHLPMIERFQTLLPIASIDDFAAYDLRPAAVAQTGARILHLLVAAAAAGSAGSGTIARRLQQSWAPDDSNAAQLINMALILCADHELNVSSFTAHCVASAGATPYEVVIAGLAALQGIKHGRATERVDAFLREATSSPEIRAVIAGRLKRGEVIPGFGHRLYGEGDPRGKLLLDAIAASYPQAPPTFLAAKIVEEVSDLIGERPNIDFGLTILARALKLPPGAPIALFALGRTIGWIGHAIEQYQVDRIIRPRARYVGEPPE